MTKKDIRPLPSTATQSRYLREQLTSAKIHRRRAIWNTPYATEPANVGAARMLVASWDKAQERRKEAWRKREEVVLETAYQSAMKAILFESPQDALKLVETFCAKVMKP